MGWSCTRARDGDGHVYGVVIHLVDEDDEAEDEADEEDEFLSANDPEADESVAGEADDQDATVSTRLRNRATIRQPERLTYETMSAMTAGMQGTAAELNTKRVRTLIKNKARTQEEILRQVLLVLPPILLQAVLQL